MYESPARRYMVPGAIVLFGMIVAIAVYFSRAPFSFNFFGNTATAQAIFRAPSLEDHTLGDPAAPIRIVEYCDMDAPFCKQFEVVMQQIIAAYGPTGQVAWTYRHFSDVTQDPDAKHDAEAAECAAAEGGSHAFFGFINAWSTATSTPDAAAIAASLSLPAADFASCLGNDTFGDEVQSSYDEAVAAGATGAPYTIVSVDGKEPFVLAGSLPFDGMNAVIQQAQAKLVAK